MSANGQPKEISEQSRINKGFIADLKRQVEASAHTPLPGFTGGAATPIDDKIKEERRRKQEIANNNAVKDQELKETTLRMLFIFLSVETAVIFIMGFLQGFGTLWRWKFHLEDWSFRVISSVTIGQITAMLIIAVQHLFPKRGK